MIAQRKASISEAGFTLAEMLVALAVTAMLLTGVLFTFDFNSRVARSQSNVSDLQQSLRVAQDDLVRLVHMTGRGSLPFPVPVLKASKTPAELQGLALGVRDNVPINQFMRGTDEMTRILPNTDVLTVRGVFGPLYHVNVAGSAVISPDNSSGTLTILDVSPGGAKQDLGPIKAAIDSVATGSENREAILLSAAVDDNIRAVVELDPAASSTAEHQVVIAFKITGGTRTDKYSQLSTGGTFQKEVKNVAFAGILEEHRYYVREEHVIAGDRSSDLAPKLARARFYPGTDDPYRGDDSNTHIDLADNIVDLQVALAFDTTVGGSGYPLLEASDGANDDWLFNGINDDPTVAVWQGPPAPAIHYARITTLARTDRRDPQYQAPLLPGKLEDRGYLPADPLNSYDSRMYRWQMLQTVIDLRNL